LELTVVDELWSLAGDGRWHTVQDLIKKSSFNGEAVNDALNFLTKYGFAQLSGAGKKAMIRAVPMEPAPSVIAGILDLLSSPHEQNQSPP